MSDYDHQNYWQLTNTRQKTIKHDGDTFEPLLSFESKHKGEIHVCVEKGYYSFLHKNRVSGWKKMYKIPYSVFKYVKQMNLPPERHVPPKRYKPKV